jgi:high-affinity iron transporter
MRRNSSPLGRVFHTGAFTLALALWGAYPAAAVPTQEAARRASHLLDYIAVDYSVAVRDGEVVSELEYREQIEFAGAVESQLARLGLSETDPLRRDLGELHEEIRARESTARVAAHARELSAAIRTRFGVLSLPPRTPDLERGQLLYTQMCLSCHGATGRGDGPAGAELNPAPTNFTEISRALELSPIALYNTISFGIAGTGMAGFADALEAANRHDLAFYVGSLAFGSQAVEQGRTLAEAAPERVSEWVPDLATLVHTPASQLAGDAEGRAVVAYLRAHPEYLSPGDVPIQVARRKLEESLRAFRAGDPEEAMDLAVSAYVDGFETVEARFDTLDREARVAIELDFMRYRALLRENASVEELERAYAALEEGLSIAGERLEEEGLAASAIFLGSLTILAREGLEALLIVVALCGVLIRAGRRDALRYVHTGWVAAFVAGGATWYAAQELVRVSGAQREVIEGITSLIAVVILFYVSYWLISKLEAARWQAFLHEKVTTALSRGALWTLGAISFIAVYRELLETVLFYQALLAQAGPGGTGPVLAGIGAGIVLLGLLASVVLYFGLYVPMRHFFSLSSGLLYALAIILAGHGIAALQEVAWLPATLISDIRFEWLGIHGTLEGLAVQGLLLAAALATVPRILMPARA